MFLWDSAKAFVVACVECEARSLESAHDNYPHEGLLRAR